MPSTAIIVLRMTQTRTSREKFSRAWRFSPAPSCAATRALPPVPSMVASTIVSGMNGITMLIADSPSVPTACATKKPSTMKFTFIKSCDTIIGTANASSVR